MCLLQKYILQGDKCGIQIHVYDAIMESFANSKMIFIPIHHLHAYHFTLLFLNISRKKCYHLNSIKFSNRASVEACYKDAQLVSITMIFFLHFLALNSI